MAWFTRKGSDSGERIAAALEQLIKLYELDLQSRGLTTQTGIEEGEVLLTDEEQIAAKELEDEFRRRFGLSPTHDFRVPAPAIPTKAEKGKAQEDGADSGGESLEALFGGSWGLGFGPEGAESPIPGPEAARAYQLGPPGSPFGPYNQKKQEGKSGPDSGEESQRGAELNSNPARKEAGE